MCSLCSQALRVLSVLASAALGLACPQPSTYLSTPGVCVHHPTSTNPSTPGVCVYVCVHAQVNTYNNILTSGLQAEWVAALLRGILVPPSQEVMLADIKQQMKWRRSIMPAMHNRGCVRA